MNTQKYIDELNNLKIQLAKAKKQEEEHKKAIKNTPYIPGYLRYEI